MNRSLFIVLVVASLLCLVIFIVLFSLICCMGSATGLKEIDAVKEISDVKFALKALGEEVEIRKNGFEHLVSEFDLLRSKVVGLEQQICVFAEVRYRLEALEKSVSCIKEDVNGDKECFVNFYIRNSQSLVQELQLLKSKVACLEGKSCFSDKVEDCLKDLEKKIACIKAAVDKYRKIL